MKFAVRVLTQYGDNPQEVYDHLATQFTEVQVYEELEPYKHYHCQVEALGKCLKQVKQMIYKIPKLNKLPRSKNNLNVDQVVDDKSYRNYMRKQNGRFCNYHDLQLEEQLNIVLLEEDNYINPKETECQFSPIQQQRGERSS